LYHFNYASAPADGSVWSVGGDTTRRMSRGGSFVQTEGACRSACRNFAAPTDRYGDFGLRLVAP
jgi:formylglycine-generating enzyme required for sulfatase activity